MGSDVITIEPNVVIKAVTWMTQYQNTDGSFREPGHVFHQSMQVKLDWSLDCVRVALFLTKTFLLPPPLLLLVTLFVRPVRQPRAIHLHIHLSLDREGGWAPQTTFLYLSLFSTAL